MRKLTRHVNNSKGLFEIRAYESRKGHVNAVSGKCTVYFCGLSPTQITCVDEPSILRFTTCWLGHVGRRGNRSFGVRR